MRNRLLLFGRRGQLGTELVQALSPKEDIVALSHNEVDLTDQDAVRQAIRAAEPEVILNAAAYTAVDRAESEPGLALAVNARAPAAMAEEAHRLNTWLIHFSTDYVFDGSSDEPWTEEAPTRPLNEYGRSKLAGERAIAATGCRHLIFRTSWVYAAHGNNFLRTVLRLAAQRPSLTVVEDQVGAPTSATELARAISAILTEIRASNTPAPDPGIYHMTCGGSTSWFGFASAIFDRVKGRFAVPALIPVPSEQYPTPAARPRNSVLNCDKLERVFGIRLPGWEAALDEVVTHL